MLAGNMSVQGQLRRFRDIRYWSAHPQTADVRADITARLKALKRLSSMASVLLWGSRAPKVPPSPTATGQNLRRLAKLCQSTPQAADADDPLDTSPASKEAQQPLNQRALLTGLEISR